MDLGIEGRVALVFGASGGLGGACARLLAAEGAAVALAGRNKGELERVAAEIGAATKSLVLPWDSDPRAGSCLKLSFTRSSGRSSYTRWFD